ncbi:Negative regulator of genetic competence MecA [Alkalibacterium sp. AK22]|uniref:adaptor protein MecA n=1 Tax=Alkalibacterium sp. AK22 TaxID=1229520 RepID=UPI00044C540C|nr:adaptor protein MecA [Alkalibacterium sp. AK22]EXJ22888.1 Negative regulator of genetic competence MecA [Alkalibacterium sp. AK22]
MEIEHINEDTIRVTIENTDLEERGITFLDLLGNQKQIEKFFYSILEEVDIDEEFQESEAVTFQVMPNNNGLELFISKGTNFKEGFNQLGGADEELASSSGLSEESVPNIEDELDTEANETKEVTIVLQDFEQMIQLSKSLYMESGLSHLYAYKNQYYLNLIFFVEEMNEKTSEEELAVALEFGEKSSVSSEVLNEYADKIMETNALELTRFYFN